MRNSQNRERSLASHEWLKAAMWHLNRKTAVWKPALANLWGPVNQLPRGSSDRVLVRLAS